MKMICQKCGNEFYDNFCTKCGAPANNVSVNTTQEVYNIKSSDGRVLRVFPDKIILTQKGLLGAMSRGFAGEKTIYYSDISSVQFKNCGWTAGFLEFTFNGSGDRSGGPMSGANNENRFTFGRPTIGAARKLAKEMEEVKSYIDRAIEASRRKIIQGGSVSQISSADEIMKFKNLLDNGIITQSEFEAKKKQLLGI